MSARAAGNDDARQQPPALGPEGFRRLDQRGVDLADRVRDDQDLLEEGPDDDDRDLRRIVDAQDRDAEGAKGRGRQITEKLDERLLQPSKKAIGAAEDPERHPQDRGNHEAPEDRADAAAQALIQPRFARQARQAVEGR